MGRWHFFELRRIARRTWPLLICFAAIFAGWGKTAPPPTPPPEVQVVAVKPQDTPVYKESTGTLEGIVNAQIRAQVTGYIQTQNYLEGKLDKTGDFLFQIYPRPSEAALHQSKGKLAP